jgi:hypothetical protein
VTDDAAVADLLAFGRPLGTVWPARPPRPLPDKDAREHSLEVLREFISRLVFRRTMEENVEPQGFQVPLDRIHIYQPDDPKEAGFPSIGFLPGRGFHESYGLGPPLPVENTVDVFGPGTVLVRQSDYVELFTIEILSAKHAVRRAIVAGLKTALRANDSSLSTDLKLANYFDQTARFWLDESTYMQEAAAVRNRRRAHLFVELRVAEVFLVDYVNMKLIVDLGGVEATEVYDGNLFLDFGETSLVERRCSDDGT